ncbi:MAG: sigma-70 family RNA polymerase sigma factor [Antricoccus sp.]
MDPVNHLIAAAHSSEWAKIVASLISTTRDWELAQDAASEAFSRAVERWNDEQIPPNPGAWLMTVARNYALDILRRRVVERAKLAEVAAMALEPTGVQDTRLNLIFTCCHPALDQAAQVALTLRTVAGLTIADIARTFVTSESAMAQRLVRARAKLKRDAVPYRVPPPEEYEKRLSAVLAVVYLTFDHGYTAMSEPSGAATAVELSDQLVDLMPMESEARGLNALLTFQHSRRLARLGEDGGLVSIEDQDRRLWRHDEIERARTLMRGATSNGPYSILAMIAREHAVVAVASETNWARIVDLYDDLLTMSPSPIIEFNRAIAVGMRDDPDIGLHLLEQLSTRLGGYRLFAAARADLLARRGSAIEAATQYRQAILLADTDAERIALQRRLSRMS